MAAQVEGWSELEEARSRLLHSTCPRGVHLVREFATRLRMWDEGQYQALLERIEWQRIQLRNGPRKRQGGPRRRALQLAQHGAYRKGVTAVTTSVADLTPEEEKDHAAALLPVSTLADALAADQASNPVLAASAQDSYDERTDGGSPLRGARFSALTAPGPSGMHARVMLSVWRRP